VDYSSPPKAAKQPISIAKPSDVPIENKIRLPSEEKDGDEIATSL
jgi:hypothetical protein